MERRVTWGRIAITALETVAKVVALVGLISLAGGLLFWLLWNAVAPVYWPQAPQITFFQGWGTAALLRVGLGGLSKYVNSHELKKRLES